MIINDPTTWPLRMKTSDVAAVLGFSVRTFQRKRKAGTLTMNPVDRGQQWLFARADVLSELGLPESAKPVSFERPRETRVDHDAIRAELARTRRVRSR